MNKEIVILGLSWYQPEQWDRLIEISEDRESLDDSYEDWKKNANKTIRDIRSAGKIARKVNINPEDLLAWCNENSLPVNGKSRSEYVTVVMDKRALKK